MTYFEHTVGSHLEKWRTDNNRCDQRHVAMVVTKLEEAELLSLRMVKQDG